MLKIFKIIKGTSTKFNIMQLLWSTTLNIIFFLVLQLRLVLLFGPYSSNYREIALQLLTLFFNITLCPNLFKLS